MKPLEVVGELAAEAQRLRKDGVSAAPREERIRCAMKVGEQHVRLGPYELERAATTIAGLVWQLELARAEIAKLHKGAR